MRSRGALPVVLAVAAVAVSAFLAYRAPLGQDYVADFRAVDTARPQIDALAGLDMSRFVHEQSPLGPVSLALRAPFAALASSADQRSRYRLGIFPCMLALALAGLGVAAVMRRRGSPLWHCALVVGLFLFAPPTNQALEWGHPEELLVAALVVAAALAAGGGRHKWAIALAGLAVATKPVAVLAVVPIALITGARPARTALLALAVGVVLVAPLAVADAHAFRNAANRANDVFAVKPMDVWWTTSTRHVTITTAGGKRQSVHRPRLPGVVNDGIRPALVVVAVLLALLAARVRPPTLERGLSLLALVYLLRCMFDPGDQTYYHVAFIACLAATEGLMRRPPLLALGAALLSSSTALRAVNSDLDSINVLYLAWSIPLSGLLAWQLLRRAPPTVERHVGATRDPAAAGPAWLPSGDARG